MLKYNQTINPTLTPPKKPNENRYVILQQF